MHELMKEYGEIIAGAVITVSVIGVFVAVLLSHDGALPGLVRSYCGYLL